MRFCCYADRECKELEELEQELQVQNDTYQETIKKLKQELEIARKVRRDFEVELINTKEELERYREREVKCISVNCVYLKEASK